MRHLSVLLIGTLLALALFAVLVPLPKQHRVVRASAPPAHTATAVSTACNGTPAVASISTASGSLIVVVALSNNNGQTITISDSASQSYTSATTVNSATSGLIIGVLYKANSTALTSVTLTMSGNSACSVSVSEYTNMATSTPLDVANSQANDTAQTGCTAPSVTTTNANDTVIGACGYPNSTFTTAAAGTGCTYTREVSLSSQADGIPSQQTEDCNLSSTGTVQPNGTIGTASRSLAGVAAFKQAVTNVNTIPGGVY